MKIIFKVNIKPNETKNSLKKKKSITTYSVFEVPVVVLELNISEASLSLPHCTSSTLVSLSFIEV